METTLKEALELVEELEQDDALAGIDAAPPMDADLAVDGPPPSEPPVSDAAIGADTEGNVALQLLTDIKDLLTQLVAIDNPEAALPGEEEQEQAAENDAVDAVPEAPEDEDDNGQPGGKPVPPS